MQLNVIKRMGFAALLFLEPTTIQASQQEADMRQPVPQNALTIKYGVLRSFCPFTAEGYSLEILGKTYPVRLDRPSQFFEHIKGASESLNLPFYGAKLAYVIDVVDNNENLAVFNAIRKIPTESVKELLSREYSRDNLVRLGEKLLADTIIVLDTMEVSSRIMLHLHKNLRRDLEAAHKRIDIRMLLLPSALYEILEGIQNTNQHQDQPTPAKPRTANRKAS